MNKYRGRFAPSPSGPLHFGSLVCALASFIDARANNGEWFIRIEDIDTTRCHNKYTDQIIESLHYHGLQSDSAILIQSQNIVRYQETINRLANEKRAYACDCSRQTIKLRSTHYDGYCKHRALAYNSNNAIRLINDNSMCSFEDRLLGRFENTNTQANIDYILKRRDGCYAYNLAVTVDDIDQKITHIVRGSDLIDTTLSQLFLFRVLDAPSPDYLHIPVAATKPHFKLSKQNHAEPLNKQKSIENTQNALLFLGFPANQVLDCTSICDLLDYAISNWTIKRIPKQSEVLITLENKVYCGASATK